MSVSDFRAPLGLLLIAFRMSRLSRFRSIVQHKSKLLMADGGSTKPRDAEKSDEAHAELLEERDRLSHATHLATAQICESRGARSIFEFAGIAKLCSCCLCVTACAAKGDGKVPTKAFMHCVHGIVFEQIRIIAVELKSFARHAGRSQGESIVVMPGVTVCQVNVEDVLLCARRNEQLVCTQALHG